MMRSVLSWKTLLVPSGVDESFATIGAVQEMAIVFVLTGLPAVGGSLVQVVPPKSDLLMFSAPKISIAPNAPFIGTESVAAGVVLVIVSVVDSNVLAGDCDAVNTTLTWQVVGAASVPVQEFPFTAKSLFPVLAPLNVTAPCP
jgi:hypothetical protein